MKHLSAIHYRLLVCLLAILAFSPATAQRRTQPAYWDEYWNYPNVYLNDQAKVAYPLIDSMLQACPPETEMSQNRQMALITLDQFLHDADYSKRTALYTFVNERMARMLTTMDKPVFSGVRVYKLYNSGFILQTLKTTVAIDLVPGGNTNKPFLTDSVITEIVRRCDALLITNSDSRHAKKSVAKEFATAGKKVFVPQGLWSGLGESVVPVGGDTVQTVEAAGMTLHILPGHNGKNTNNIYIMDFQGRGVVAHTGAQDNDADYDRISQIHSQYDTDILLTRSANLRLEDMLAGFQPRMVITAHENEMESTVDKRESYWATQKRLKRLAELNIPNVVMTWGESYDYADTESRNISSSASKVFINGVLYIERKGSIYTPAGIRVK